MGLGCEVTGAGVYGKSVSRRLSYSLGRCATVFLAEVFAISPLHMILKIREHQRNT
jgi:hypothetical protein